MNRQKRYDNLLPAVVPSVGGLTSTAAINPICISTFGRAIPVTLTLSAVSAAAFGEVLVENPILAVAAAAADY